MLMPVLDPDFDLTLLQPYFTTAEDYDSETILKELQVWQKTGDFFCLVFCDGSDIRGFIVGHVQRKTLFIDESYHKKGADFAEAKKGFEVAKEWARKRGLTSITGETQRNEIGAMSRFGFEYFSTIMKVRL